MKTRYKIATVAFCVVVAAYVSIISYVAGTEDVFNVSSVLYFPSIVIQLVANEGNGIICVDACGPCSSWGPYYVLIDGKCVDGPDGKVCSNNAFGEQWRFFDGRCSSFISERVPHEFSNSFVNSKIISCNKISVDDLVCNPMTKNTCPDTDDAVWRWADMYELCFKMQDYHYAVPECDKVSSDDKICSPKQNNYLCPQPHVDFGWGYNNLDNLCYKWEPVEK